MSEWREPLPEPESDLIEPPFDPEEDEDDEPDDEDIPLVDATENRR